MQKAITGATLVIGALLYPVCVYVGLTHIGIARSAHWLALLALVAALVQWLSRGRQGLLALLFPALFIAGLALVGGWVSEARLLLLFPVVMNLGFFVSFGQSLWVPPPMVERFARLMDPELSPPEVQYCRRVTQVWCGFFGLNAATTALLGWFAPLAWWAAYSGFIAYVLVGLLMAAEYLVRKRRFQKFGPGRLDRLLASLLSVQPRKS